MGSESNMRQRIVRLLKPLDGRSVENPVGPGTPDVNYIHGWIELKCVPKWPAHGGALRVRHFTKQQKVWLMRRRRMGGVALVLLKVGTDWLLLDGDVAAGHLGYSPKEELIGHSIFYWPGSLNEKELLEYLAATHAS